MWRPSAAFASNYSAINHSVSANDRIMAGRMIWKHIRGKPVKMPVVGKVN
jgi:hypothetical protein